MIVKYTDFICKSISLYALIALIVHKMGRKAVSFLFYGISVVLTGLLLVAAVLCRYASSVSPGEGGF